MTESDLPESLPGFDRPIELLRACHTKILSHCDLLEALILQLKEGQTDEAELRRTARKIVTYFTTSSRQHHQDEEVELFTRLARQSLKLADMIHSLKQEHTELDALWMALEPELKQFPDVTDPGSLKEKVDRFCQLSRSHVKRENMEFLPMAEGSLSREQLKDIGISMAERRGVRYTG